VGGNHIIETSGSGRADWDIMSRSRFTSAKQVFDAFETAPEDIEATPSEADPLNYVMQLLKGPTPEATISFCAYLLPRREAVWWACQAIRESGTPDDAELLTLAEEWVRVPEEKNRRLALSGANNAKVKGPCAWAAYGAGWSGGSMTDNVEQPVRPPAYLTAKAVRACVLTVLASALPKQRLQRVTAVAMRATELLNAGAGPS
jgi:hypothetical protein